MKTKVQLDKVYIFFTESFDRYQAKLKRDVESAIEDVKELQNIKSEKDEKIQK